MFFLKFIINLTKFEIHIFIINLFFANECAFPL